MKCNVNLEDAKQTQCVINKVFDKCCLLLVAISTVTCVTATKRRGKGCVATFYDQLVSITIENAALT